VALPSDYAAIRELMREEDSLHAGARADVFVYPVVRTLSTEHLDGLRTSSDAALWVAEADGGVVGLAIVVARARNPELQLFREPRFVTLQDLVVASEHRRQGIGTALVRRAEAWAVEQGFKCLELSVWEFNRSAIEFYRSLGYDTDHRRMSREL
jgi:ribosomal protein S18 acetylase RimI-like enzyme